MNPDQIATGYNGNDQGAAGINAEGQRSLPEGALQTDLSFGDKGDDVKVLQKSLQSIGYDVGKADGDWGPKTEAAYQDYLKDVKNGVWNISDTGRHALNLTPDQRAIASRLLYEQLGIAPLNVAEREYYTILQVAQDRVTGSVEHNPNVVGELGASTARTLSSVAELGTETQALRAAFEINFSEGAETLERWNASNRANTMGRLTESATENIENVDARSRAYVLAAARTIIMDEAGLNPVVLPTEYIRFAHGTPTSMEFREQLGIQNVPNTIIVRQGRTGPRDPLTNYPWR